MIWNNLELPDNPYYKDEDSLIYCADCRLVLPLIPDKSIDLVLSDPPYNVGKDYGEYNDNNPDYDAFSQQWFNEVNRIASLIAFTPGVVNFQDWIRREQASWIASWQISNGVSRGGQIQFITWEPILIYGKIKMKVNRDTYNVAIGFQTAGLQHPCPKPTRLWDLLVLDYSLEGEIILDPFLGSGTTCYCAKKLGRKCIGIEIEEKFCEIAAQRCSQGVLLTA